MKKIQVEFGGGLELLFDGKKEVMVEPTDQPDFSLSQLIEWIRDNLVKERHELFVSGNTVRPGILVLVNEVDWELEGKGNYEVQDGDCIAFISTLHGG